MYVSMYVCNVFYVCRYVNYALYVCICFYVCVYLDVCCVTYNVNNPGMYTTYHVDNTDNYRID